jgi:hypothetical protein
VSTSDDSLLVGRIVIVRRLTDDNDLVMATADDGQGGPLAAITVLGMLTLAQSLALDDMENLRPADEDEA